MPPLRGWRLLARPVIGQARAIIGQASWMTVLANAVTAPAS